MSLGMRKYVAGALVLGALAGAAAPAVASVRWTSDGRMVVTERVGGDARLVPPSIALAAAEYGFRQGGHMRGVVFGRARVGANSAVASVRATTHGVTIRGTFSVTRPYMGGTYTMRMVGRLS